MERMATMVRNAQGTVPLTQNERTSASRHALEDAGESVGGEQSQVERDRRASRRFPCEGTAQVIVLGGALVFEGKIRDLSATGCCLKTKVQFTLERGTHVEIVMVVNGTQFRVAGGVRANHKIRGVGLEFMNLSARSQTHIRHLIAELETMG